LDPGVVLNLGQGESLVRIISKNAADEVFDFVTQPHGELQVYLFYSVIGCLVVLRLEGRIADDELVAEDAERPNVHLVVVGLVIDHLRRQIVESATEGLPPVVRSVDAPPKVSNLNCTL
jgi:hypothetical protein